MDDDGDAMIHERSVLYTNTMSMHAKEMINDRSLSHTHTNTLRLVGIMLFFLLREYSHHIDVILRKRD